MRANLLIKPERIKKKGKFGAVTYEDKHLTIDEMLHKMMRVEYEWYNKTKLWKTLREHIIFKGICLDIQDIMYIQANPLYIFLYSIIYIFIILKKINMFPV